ncbi:hypothetical protein OEW28_12070 [Defluviimonas sp. WL0002]|uniref:Cytochrome b562 n=1 Tax=Albidovulum marisflavi TaxID=2984159 RepID=A0ABT2ZE55_9RHOB|nr:hypothetical protein [Defluviimonas sp. WL0002]MCV2869361.1 hypothetical protein [Defluviimonas sp. WL0002]
MKRLGPLITAFALLATSSAHAGPVAEFEASFREMYGIYRIALFQTNAGEHAESFTAVTDLSDQLAALAEIWGEDPPPQYQDDHLWGATIDTARALVGTANDQVAAHELSEAHETLESLRDLFGELHARNGIETFSDRMNAYHAAM